TWRRGWKWGRALDLRRVVLQPFAVIESDRGDDATPMTVGSGEPAFLNGALRKYDLVSEGADSHRLDIDAELAGPERRQRKVWPTIGLEAHHVVRSDLGPKDGIVPVLQGEKLILIHHVREPRDVAGDENGIRYNAVDVEGAAARIAAYAPETGGQTRPLQP